MENLKPEIYLSLHLTVKLPPLTASGGTLAASLPNSQKIMLKLLIDFFTKKAEKIQEDELIGVWTNEDDGSGLINMFGWSLHFLENGKGKSYDWHNNTQDSYHFEWERVSKNIIKLRSENEKWKSVTYEIQKYVGAYESKQFRLTEIGKNEFWNSQEPLFQKKDKKPAANSRLSQWLYPIFLVGKSTAGNFTYLYTNRLSFPPLTASGGTLADILWK